MGSTLTLGTGSSAWLWNISARALPPGASNAAILSYMKYLAAENGITLDPRTNNVLPTRENQAKLAGGKLLVPDYKAPSKEELAAGKGELAMYMHGPAVTELKQLLNARGAKLDASNDVYDEATRKAWDEFRSQNGLPVRKDGVVTAAAYAKLKAPPEPAKDTVERKDGPTEKAPEIEKPGDQKTKWDPNQKKFVPITTNPKGRVDEVPRDLAPDQRADVQAALRGARTPEARQRILELASQQNFKLLDAAMRREVLGLAASPDPEARGLADTIAKSDRYNRADDRVKGLVLAALRDPKNAGAVDAILKDERGTDAQLEALNRLIKDGRAAQAAANGRAVVAVEALEKDPRFTRLAEDQRNDVLEALYATKDPAARARIAAIAVSPNFAVLDKPARKLALRLEREGDADGQQLAELMARSDLYNRTDGRVKAQVVELLRDDLHNAKALLRVLRDLAGQGTDAQLEALKQIPRG